jgi:hypothetical protein
MQQQASDPQIMDCGPIEPQVICDELVWDKAIFLQELTHEAQPASDDDLSGGVDPVDLKPVLGKIEPDGSNLHAGGSSQLVAFSDDHIDAGEREPSTPSRYSKAARVNKAMRH